MIQVFPRSGNLLLPSPAHRRALAGLPPLRVSRTSFAPGQRVYVIQPSPFRRGLGASAAGEKVGGTILSVAAATGPAAPIVAAVGALVSLISSLVGGGCGQACIVSAQAQQIYEVACDDLESVAKRGMLGANDYLAGIQNFLQAGQQHLQQLVSQGDQRAQGGITKLDQDMQPNQAFANSLPATATVPLDLTQAQTAFIDPSTKGWYAASVSSGNQLALAYLQSVQAAQQAAAQSQSSGIVVSSASGTVSVLGQTFSLSTGLVALAALAAVIYFAS